MKTNEFCFCCCCLGCPKDEIRRKQQYNHLYYFIILKYSILVLFYSATSNYIQKKSLGSFNDFQTMSIQLLMKVKHFIFHINNFNSLISLCSIVLWSMSSRSYLSMVIVSFNYLNIRI